MRLLFDFAELERVRPRDIAKITMYALIAQNLGHEVFVHDNGGALARMDHTRSMPTLAVSLPTKSLTPWQNQEPDVYLSTDVGLRERGLIDRSWRRDTPTIILGLRHQTKKNEERILACVDLLVTVKHSLDHPRILSVKHCVSQRVLETLVEDGLFEAYMTDDLDAIRKAYPAEGERRLAGFIGYDDYNRRERIARLPPWVDCRWFKDDSVAGGYLPTRDYLRWLAGCKAAVDMPGQHPKTYRFTEAVMLGVPVICVPGVQACTVPVTIANAITLRFWADLNRLDRLMGNCETIRTCADYAYREAWSLRAQTRLMLEWICHTGTRTPPPRTVRGANLKADDLDAELGPCSVDYSPVMEPTVRISHEARFKVLAIIDEYGWAYHNRAIALKKYAPKDWLFTIQPWRDVRWTKVTRAYDLIYLLDYAQTETARHHITEHHSKVPLVVSYNADIHRRQDWWPRVCHWADWVVCVNRQRWLHRGGCNNCCAISNGVDLTTFQPMVPINERPHRILWCGSIHASGDKGHTDILPTLERTANAAGFMTDFRLIGNEGVKRFSPAEQAAWYNTGSYILCASASEGTANTITEGVACGCIAVSTPVGNIVEWGKSRTDCVIVPRSPGKLQWGLGIARAQRDDMGRRSLHAIQRWNWEDRSQYYYAVFKKLMKGEPVRPFVYSDCQPGDI